MEVANRQAQADRQRALADRERALAYQEQAEATMVVFKIENELAETAVTKADRK